VCSHVVEMTRPLAKRGVEVKMSMSPDVPMIRGDPERIKQILHNLLGNAAKFTAKGAITLTVDVDRDRRNVLLAVKDTGTGIKPDHLNKIWGAFNQGDEGMARTFGGTGLGLTIAKQLAEAHAGEIVVTSKVGIGTTFTVRLPIQVEVKAPEREVVAEAVDRSAAVADAPDPPLEGEQTEEERSFQSYSELNRGAIEVLSVDDDPVN
jgi:signal transduction histidine kinase